APRVADAREDVLAVDHAVPERDIAIAVHRGAAHPAMHAVCGCEGALLVHGVATLDATDFVPAHARDLRTRLDRLVRDERFILAEMTIGQSPERSLTGREDVEIPGLVFS